MLGRPLGVHCRVENGPGKAQSEGRQSGTERQRQLKNLAVRGDAGGEVPGGPGTRTRCSHCCGLGSIPGWGMKILQAAGPKKKKKKGGAAGRERGKV